MVGYIPAFTQSSNQHGKIVRILSENHEYLAEKVAKLGCFS